MFTYYLYFLNRKYLHFISGLGIPEISTFKHVNLSTSVGKLIFIRIFIKPPFIYEYFTSIKLHATTLHKYSETQVPAFTKHRYTLWASSFHTFNIKLVLNIYNFIYAK